MKTKYYFTGILFALCLTFNALAEEVLSGYEILKDSYIRHDDNLLKTTIESDKTKVSAQKTLIANGFNLNVSTGSVRTKFLSDGVEFSLSTEVEFDMPQLNDTSLSLSADILSNNTKKRKIALLKSERNVLNAKRNLQNGFISAEKSFYTELKSLYNQKSQLLTAEQDFYDAQLSFEQVRVQGYSTSSTKYRTAQLKVMTAKNTVESKRRDFEREVKIFAAKCGVEYNYTDPADFLPTSIPEVEAVDVKSFDQETYTKLESAKWNQYINNLERSSDSAITLSANAGVTFNYNDQNYNTINVGSDFTWNNTGLKLSAGANIPVGTDTRTPVLTMGVSIDPNAFRKAKINSQIDEIDEQQETIEVINAQEDYYTAVISQESSLQNILWEKQSASEFYEMYKKLASDMASYYRQGLITESEYRKNVASRDSYEIKLLVNDLDLIIYNNTTKLLFCPEIEDLDLEAIGGKDEE